MNNSNQIKYCESRQISLLSRSSTALRGWPFQWLSSPESVHDNLPWYSHWNLMKNWNSVVATLFTLLLIRGRAESLSHQGSSTTPQRNSPTTPLKGKQNKSNWNWNGFLNNRKESKRKSKPKSAETSLSEHLAGRWSREHRNWASWMLITSVTAIA